MVKWAPLSVPLERRLQTAAVLLAMTMMPISLSILGLLCFWPPLVALYGREIVALICLWTYVIDRNTPARGGRPVSWMPRLRWWYYLQRYFPAELHVVGKFDPEKKYFFGISPHGIIGTSTVSNIVTEHPDGAGIRAILGDIDFRILTVSFNFQVPLYRDFLMALGFVSASRSSANYLLSRGKSVFVVVGGADEALDARPGVVDLTLAKRKGFVRLALKQGAALVPVFGFGENDAFDQVANPPGSRLREFQLWMKRKFGFTTPLVKGRGIFQYSFGMLPFRRPLHTVVGEPIELPQQDEPKEEDVDKYHAEYVKALTALYNKYRKQYEHPLDASGKPIESQGMRIVG